MSTKLEAAATELSISTGDIAIADRVNQSEAFFAVSELTVEELEHVSGAGKGGSGRTKPKGGGASTAGRGGSASPALFLF